MESIVSENKELIKVDRVVLETSSVAIIQRISDQIQNGLGDLVHLSQKDIVNFLIQKRSAELTTEELDRIKTEHFDIVRALKRATNEAIKAKQNGHDIQMDELLKIIQTPSVSANNLSKKLRKRRKNSSSQQAIIDEKSISDSPGEALKSPIGRKLKNSLIDSKNENLQSDNVVLAT